MEFDMGSLVHGEVELTELASPFLVAEIDNIIKIMPSDKAPGPDGFNGTFIKKYWPIIKEAIYRIFFEFYENRVILSAINGSHIVLVPKNNNPIMASDY